jgi:uncharacterized surface protein with fasciclin (FAS1) repeats
MHQNGEIPSSFARIRAREAGFLLNDPDQLANSLPYHVVPDLRRVQSLLSEGQTTTLHRSPVTTTFDNFARSLFINDSKVINPTILAPSGSDRTV